MRSKNLGAYLGFMTMAGMFSDPYMRVYDDDLLPPKSKTKKIVEPKIHKCFRPDCDRERNGNQLYCSKECFELDKERIKRK